MINVEIITWNIFQVLDKCIYCILYKLIRVLQIKLKSEDAGCEKPVRRFQRTHVQ